MIHVYIYIYISSYVHIGKFPWLIYDNTMLDNLDYQKQMLFKEALSLNYTLV